MISNTLKLDGLVVAREGAALTQPITLSLEAGEMLVVRGGNGAGKSSFLKTLAGLLRPKAGSIIREGAKLEQSPILHIGHKLGLSPEMSVRDNVDLWAQLNDAPELTPAALHYFDLGDISDVAVGKLSAGWQQRVALTRLITVPSLLWLLDEPTSNLDSEGVALLRSLMESRLEQGGLVAVATHAELQGTKVKTININAIN